VKQHPQQVGQSRLFAFGSECIEASELVIDIEVGLRMRGDEKGHFVEGKRVVVEMHERGELLGRLGVSVVHPITLSVDECRGGYR